MIAGQHETAHVDSQNPRHAAPPVRGLEAATTATSAADAPVGALVTTFVPTVIPSSLADSPAAAVASEGSSAAEAVCHSGSHAHASGPREVQEPNLPGRAESASPSAAAQLAAFAHRHQREKGGGSQKIAR